MYDNPQQIRDEITQLQQNLKEVSPAENEGWHGRAHHRLGRLLTELSLFEKPVEHLESALKHYEIAETFITVIEEPIHYPNMINDKGILYLELARHQDTHLNLQRAETAFKEILKFWTPETRPREYTGVHINLSGLCLDLAVVDDKNREEHLLRSLRYVQEGLKYKERMSGRERFLTLDNMGLTYVELGKLYQDATYFDKAVETFQDVLRYLSPEEQVHDYAITSGNLSQALKQIALLSNDKESWQRMLDVVQGASQKYKQVGRMDVYGAACLNATIAYWNLFLLAEAKDEKRKLLHEVEKNATIAVENLTDSDLQWEDRVYAYQLLGEVYSHFADEGNTRFYIDKAITNYKQALDVRLIETAPLKHADINYNIGQLFTHLNRHSDALPYLREAEKYYLSNNDWEAAQKIRQILRLTDNPINQALGKFRNWMNRQK